jgi:hypothetical protein
MEQSTGVREGILRFYERFSAGETAGFEEVIAAEPGVSVVGTGPDEGHGTRADWVATTRRARSGSASIDRRSCFPTAPGCPRG